MSDQNPLDTVQAQTPESPIPEQQMSPAPTPSIPDTQMTPAFTTPLSAEDPTGKSPGIQAQDTVAAPAAPFTSLDTSGQPMPTSSAQTPEPSFGTPPTFNPELGPSPQTS